MNQGTEQPPEAEAPPAQGKLESNPFFKGVHLTMSMPSEVEIAFVQLDHLEEYEFWFLVTSLLAAVLVGFVVPFFENTKDSVLGYISLVWATLFVLCLYRTLSVRKKLRQTRKVKAEISNVKEVPDSITNARHQG
ncbi:MAG: hypothetical protein JRN35_07845 [Nitrososphaerota archaeon]|nr:hypothetical protein [Nitrososphaerota archaeon]